MKTPLLLAATALVLGTSAAGIALATPRLLDQRFAAGIEDGTGGRPPATVSDRFRLADRDHHRRHEARDHRRGHDADDEDGDEGDGHRRGGDRDGRAGPAGSIDPNAPVPENGLFQGKARPKVEVN